MSSLFRLIPIPKKDSTGNNGVFVPDALVAGAHSIIATCPRRTYGGRKSNPFFPFFFLRKNLERRDSSAWFPVILSVGVGWVTGTLTEKARVRRQKVVLDRAHGLTGNLRSSRCYRKLRNP